MKKVSKSLIIINIISLILVYVLGLNKAAFIYSEYIFTYLKFITIFVGLSATISAIIELKNKNILIGIFNILVIVLTLPISFFRTSNYTFLFIPLIVSIVNLVLLIKYSDSERLNVICIMFIMICTIIEIVCVFIPISYSNANIKSFEKSLPQIEQLNIYLGPKSTDLEGFNVMINGKKIRLEYKNTSKETIFSDINGNELYRIKNMLGHFYFARFMSYIFATEKYGISVAND